MTDPATADPAALRPSPLAELSELLGVEVTDVRQPDPGWWELRFAAEPGRSFRYHSRVFRSERGSKWLWLSASMTKEDGRRALRLMHEHVESTTDTNTEGTNQR